MHCMPAIMGAWAALLSVQGVWATQHGEAFNMEGKDYRWQEIADGVFTGVPEAEWSDRVHKRSWEFDIHETLAEAGFNGTHLVTRDLEARALTFKEFCEASVRCVQDAAGSSWAFAVGAWTAAADAAAAARNMEVMAFLNQPFNANLYGVGGQNLAVGLVMMGANYGMDHKDKKTECAANDNLPASQAEMLRATLDWVSQQNQSARQVWVDVHGPNGEFSIKFGTGSAASPPQLDCKA